MEELINYQLRLPSTATTTSLTSESIQPNKKLKTKNNEVFKLEHHTLGYEAYGNQSAVIVLKIRNENEFNCLLKGIRDNKDKFGLAGMGLVVHGLPPPSEGESGRG